METISPLLSGSFLSMELVSSDLWRIAVCKGSVLGSNVWKSCDSKIRNCPLVESIYRATGTQCQWTHSAHSLSCTLTHTGIFFLVKILYYWILFCIIVETTPQKDLEGLDTLMRTSIFWISVKGRALGPAEPAMGTLSWRLAWYCFIWIAPIPFVSIFFKEIWLIPKGPWNITKWLCCVTWTLFGNFISVMNTIMSCNDEIAFVQLLRSRPLCTSTTVSAKRATRA